MNLHNYDAYVGLDVHKEQIAVAVAYPGRTSPEYRGEIKNTPTAVRRLAQRLSPNGERLNFCYEAGPTGYGVYRDLTQAGHHCEVVAPSLIPRKSGERVKTDRRDAVKLAQAHRSGDLTAVSVPDEEQEAMRDLTRAREDLKALEREAKQRLPAFLLRHNRVFTEDKKHWTKTHFRWLRQQKFASPVQQIVFQEYLDTVLELQQRVESLKKQMEQALEGWSRREEVEALMARGVKLITGMTVLAELGDLTRFENPRQLMAFVGLVPGERSSGQTRKRGGITKTGNGHARRVLVEAAWNYRFPARKTEALQRRAEKTSAAVQKIAWDAQKRLCGRYAKLCAAGKVKQKVCTAVAREMLGFMWAIACEVNGQPYEMRSVD